MKKIYFLALTVLLLGNAAPVFACGGEDEEACETSQVGSDEQDLKDFQSDGFSEAEANELLSFKKKSAASDHQLQKDIESDGFSAETAKELVKFHNSLSGQGESTEATNEDLRKIRYGTQEEKADVEQRRGVCWGQEKMHPRECPQVIDSIRGKRAHEEIPEAN